MAMTPTESPAQPGIYLDEPFTNALLVRGYNEDRIKSYTGGKSPYERDFLGRFANPYLAKAALQNLVLYEKCYLCPNFDNFVVSEFEKDGVLEIARMNIRLRDPEMACPVDRDIIADQGLLYPVLNSLRSSDQVWTSEQLQEVIRDLDEYNALLWERFELQSQLLLPGLGALGGKRTIRKRLTEIEDKVRRVIPVFKAVGHVFQLTSISAKYGVPALWLCPSAVQEKPIPTVRMDDVLVGSVYFSELASIKVTSMGDALRLRAHPAIADFRYEVLTMTDRVRNGSIGIDEIRKRINEANRVLKDAKLAGRVGDVITWLGIPALAMNPLGTALTVAGVSLLAGRAAAHKSVKWTLVSERTVTERVLGTLFAIRRRRKRQDERKSGE